MLEIVNDAISRADDFDNEIFLAHETCPSPPDLWEPYPCTGWIKPRSSKINLDILTGSAVLSVV